MTPTEKAVSDLRKTHPAFIQITDKPVATRIIAARDERPAMEVRSQKGYLWGNAEYPRAFEVSLEKDQPAYAAGFYAFSAESFTVDEYERLALSRYRKELVPLPDTAAQAHSSGKAA